MKKRELNKAIAEPTTKNLMTRYRSAQDQLRRAQAQLKQAREALKNDLLRRYGRGVKVLYALHDMAAWVYHACTSATSHMQAAFEGDKLAVREMTTSDHAFVAENEK